MATDLFSREQIEGEPFPVIIDGEIIGHVGLSTWEDMGSPDRKRAVFEVPDEYKEEEE